jgi:hypothetical protein
MALSNDQVLGIILIVLGVIVLAGWLSGALITIAAVALIVVGILILLGKMRGSQLVGVLCLVFGILLLFPVIPGLGSILGALERIVFIVIGVLLVVYGILKVAQKA